MPEVIQQMLDAVGGVFDSPVVQFGLRAIGLYIAAIWLATAYWAFRDMQLRTTNPILPYFAASLIILFTPIFFIFGVLTYRIVRPQEKIGETYERTLAEEALLAEVESVKSCPTCARRVDDEWIICPTCRTRLNRVCPNCSRLVGLDWSLCAWCGRDFERAPGAEPLNNREALQPRDAGRDMLPSGSSRSTVGSAAALAAAGAVSSGGQSQSSRSQPAPNQAPAAPPVARAVSNGSGNGSNSGSSSNQAAGSSAAVGVRSVASAQTSGNGSSSASNASAAKASTSSNTSANRARLPFSVKRPAGVPAAGGNTTRSGSASPANAPSDSLADD